MEQEPIEINNPRNYFKDLLAIFAAGVLTVPLAVAEVIGAASHQNMGLIESVRKNFIDIRERIRAI